MKFQKFLSFFVSAIILSNTKLFEFQNWSIYGTKGRVFRYHVAIYSSINLLINIYSGHKLHDIILLAHTYWFISFVFRK